jgi:molybdenum cofactor guanylyltransferase
MTRITTGSGIAATSTIAGYVTAGGQSKRFGQDKALATLGGEPMLSRMCRLVTEATGSVTIVADHESRYAEFGKWIVEDLWPGEGPLGGIITALLATRETDGGRDWNLIVSCDMPFLTTEFLAFLIGRAMASNAKAVVPQSQHGREPLCACWRTSAAPQLQLAFEGGMRRVNDALKLLNAEVLDESHWKRFDSAGKLFWNMNTLEDYREAQRILAANDVND